MAQNEELVEKLKRFDDVFSMLLLVMTVTTSIGLNTYSGLDLWLTLGYLVVSLGLWALGHSVGFNSLFRSLEASIKQTAWVLALLVTGSTFAKFALRTSMLNLGARLLVFLVTLALTIVAYYWFGESISPHTRRRFMRVNLILLAWFLGSYIIL